MQLHWFAKIGEVFFQGRLVLNDGEHHDAGEGSLNLPPTTPVEGLFSSYLYSQVLSDTTSF